MRVIQCSNGHFFDGDKYEVCPHCGSGLKENSVSKKERTHSFFKRGNSKVESYESADSIQSLKDEKKASDAYDEVTEVSNAPFCESSKNEQNQNAITSSINSSPEPVKEESDVTEVRDFSSGFMREPVKNVEPVVGWLVCIHGKYYGNSFVIKSGRNSVGRDTTNRISISGDNTVSNIKHLWITYEPRAREFFVQPGEGSGLVYLNGRNVMDPQKLNAYDK